MYVNGVASDSCVISTGVPQGSILGPLLFIIFINDLPKISTFFSTRLYADDTSLTASGCDLDSLLCEINNHLPAVYDWLCSNKLTLNLTKTKYIIFMPRQKESYNLYPPLTVANVYLDKSSCVKYLGVYIDCHLTPHYLSLHLLKFPDIVKLNTCMLFYDYFHHEKFRNISVSLVSELHNYNTHSASSNQIFIPSFRTNLKRFCPTIIGCFFWNHIPHFIRDKPSKKIFRKALLRWYLAQY